MTGGHYPAVGDEQHPLGAETLRQLAHALDAVDAKGDPGPRLIIKSSEGGGEVGVSGHMSRLSEFERAAAIEELEQVAFMGLIPRDLHRGDRTQVQAVDLRRFEQSRTESRVVGDGGGRSE